jgi:hypothetical protein
MRRPIAVEAKGDTCRVFLQLHDVKFAFIATVFLSSVFKLVANEPYHWRCGSSIVAGFHD